MEKVGLKVAKRAKKTLEKLADDGVFAEVKLPKWTVKKLLLTQLIVVILAALGIGGFLVAQRIPRTLRSDFPKIARAFYVAEISYLRQGQGKPINPDYTGGNIVRAEGEDTVTDQLTWGLPSNSVWLAQLFRNIVPFYAYEKFAREGRTPSLIVFLPLSDHESFHILGMFIPMYDAIVINERVLYDARLNDDRSMLGVLIHEGIHAQGGNYLIGSSVWVEAHTVAATLEVEAAMCNYGNEVACRTFWYDLHDLSKSTVRSYARQYGAEGLFALVNKLLWRDSHEWSWVDKSARYWADNQGELGDLLLKYDQLPFEDLVIPNVCSLSAFDTGLNYWADDGVLRRLLAVFDDTQYMLGIHRPVICRGAVYEPNPALSQWEGQPGNQ